MDVMLPQLAGIEGDGPEAGQPEPADPQTDMLETLTIGGSNHYTVEQRMYLASLYLTQQEPDKLTDMIVNTINGLPPREVGASARFRTKDFAEKVLPLCMARVTQALILKNVGQPPEVCSYHSLCLDS